MPESPSQLAQARFASGGRPIAVIICTHNPRRDYFERTLAALRAQTLAGESWELIVIDNASTPECKPRLEDISWHPNARLLTETKLGLTPARLRGIREARAELLVFVDDDNVLDGDFLEVALKIAQEKPFLGAWSGQCLPSFEAPPPEWTRRYWGSLVIRQFDQDAWSNLPRLGDTMPCGAGLCVRRQVAQRYRALHDAGKRLFQLDRTGDSLVSGGDNDLAGCACDVGLGVGLMPALKLTHLIPPERLTEAYLSRLAEGISFSAALLDAERGRVAPRRGLIGKIADAFRLARLSARDRRIMRASLRGQAKAQDYLRRRSDRTSR